MVSGLGFMVDFKPSLDVDFQYWVDSHHTDFFDAFFVHISDEAMSLGTVGYMAGWWAAGWISDDEEILELASLTSESLTVAQFNHVSLKLLSGREGPEDGDAQGVEHYFTHEYWPNGTPSGHTASLTAVLSVLAEYYDSWALRGFTVAAAAYMGANLVYTREHFFSDIIFGGAIGYAVGIYVVRNRSSRFRYREDGDSYRLGVMPLQLQGGGGLQLVGMW